MFWLIPVILLTGLQNMDYWGVLDLDALLHTRRGQRMLATHRAATVLPGVYYTVPLLLRASHDHTGT